MTAHPESLCHGCAHLRLVESAKGSVFLRCVQGAPPKYPPQPVVACAVFAAKTKAEPES